MSETGRAEQIVRKLPRESGRLLKRMKHRSERRRAKTEADCAARYNRYSGWND